MKKFWKDERGIVHLPFAAAIAILGIACGFASGAFPVDHTKTVQLEKLQQGEPGGPHNK